VSEFEFQDFILEDEEKSNQERFIIMVCGMWKVDIKILPVTFYLLPVLPDTTVCPEKKALKEGFFIFWGPFSVLPRTSLTTFVAVRHSGNHKSFHV